MKLTDNEIKEIEQKINNKIQVTIKHSKMYDNKVTVTSSLIDKYINESYVDPKFIASSLDDGILESMFNADVFYNNDDKTLEINLYDDADGGLEYAIYYSIKVIISKIFITSSL